MEQDPRNMIWQGAHLEAARRYTERARALAQWRRAGRHAEAGRGGGEGRFAGSDAASRGGASRRPPERSPG